MENWFNGNDMVNFEKEMLKLTLDLKFFGPWTFYFWTY